MPTLRQKFADDSRFSSGKPVLLAAILLASHERGDAGFDTSDPTFQARVQTLAAMTDEQFDREHARVMFELSAKH